MINVTPVSDKKSRSSPKKRHARKRASEFKLVQLLMGRLIRLRLRFIHLRASRITTVRWNHRNWSLQGKVQHRLGRQLDLLTLRGSLYASADATARGRADRRALTTAGNATG